ncbi:MAG: dihydropteroate synthase [Thermodesulfobacteriota bacterium]|nr:dihydropteroate synthase [Thermodesulfobacteriota bacterium]
METKVKSSTKEVVIRDAGPTVLIGERINPAGKKKLAEALKSGDMERVKNEALKQVTDGADILDVNVVTPGVEEAILLPRVVTLLMETVEVPLCIDINDPKALEYALNIYQGKPIVNSVTGQEASLNAILPLVKQYGAVVIGLTMDDSGIPKGAEKRVDIAHKIVERADALGIPREDMIIDCLTLTVGADDRAALETLEAIRGVRAELGVNQTLGASNISFGLPDRHVINHAFLAMAIEAGVTCPTVDVRKVRPTVLAVDLLLGHDRFAQRYIKDYNQRMDKR